MYAESWRCWFHGILFTVTLLTPVRVFGIVRLLRLRSLSSRDQNEVLASEIMQKAGVTTIDGFILEALDHKNGKAVQDFNPGDKVDLTLKDRKFFRITPGGGGFS